MIGVPICPSPVLDEIPPNAFPDSNDGTSLRPRTLRIKTDHLMPGRGASRHSKGQVEGPTPKNFSGVPFTPSTSHTFGIPNQFVSTPRTALPARRRPDPLVLRARRDRRYQTSYAALKTALSHTEYPPRDSVVDGLEQATAYMSVVVREARERLEDLRAQLADNSNLDRLVVADMQRERWMYERRCSSLEEEVLTLKTTPSRLHDTSTPTLKTSRDAKCHRNLAMFFERSPTKILTRRRTLPMLLSDELPTSRLRTTKTLMSPKRLRPPSPRTLWKSQPLPDVPSPSTATSKTPTQPWLEALTPTLRRRSTTVSTSTDSLYSPLDPASPFDSRAPGTALVHKPLSPPRGHTRAPSPFDVDIPGYVWDLLDEFDNVGEDIMLSFERSGRPSSPALPQFAKTPRNSFADTDVYPVTPSTPGHPPPSIIEPPPPPPTLGHSRRRTTAFSLSRWTSSPRASSSTSNNTSTSSITPHGPPPGINLHLKLSPDGVRRRSQSHPLLPSPISLTVIPESPNSASSPPPPVSASLGSQRSRSVRRAKSKSSISSLFKLGGHTAVGGNGNGGAGGGEEEGRSQETLYIQATNPDGYRDPFSVSTLVVSPYLGQEEERERGESVRSESMPGSLGRRGSVVNKLRKRLHIK